MKGARYRYTMAYPGADLMSIAKTVDSDVEEAIQNYDSFTEKEAAEVRNDFSGRDIEYLIRAAVEIQKSRDRSSLLKTPNNLSRW